MPSSERITYLISVPRSMSRSFSSLYPDSDDSWFVASDPVGLQVGSGGGTAFLLLEAWRKQGQGLSFLEWFRSSKKMIIHGGGRSRRLPSYASCGKPFIPIPITRTAFGERLDQKLVDLQIARFKQLLDNAPDSLSVLIAAGDLLLEFDVPEEPLPNVDVLCFGVKEEAEHAQDFGVFFTDLRDTKKFIDVLQKPSVEQIIARSYDRAFFVDTGTWLLSEDAILTILAKTGWNMESQSFSGWGPKFYDLYGNFGLSLGEKPTAPDTEIEKLRSAVVELKNPQFLHMGTNRQMIESVSARQAEAASKTRGASFVRHPDVYIQNSHFYPSIRRAANTFIWIENSVVPLSWEIAREHVLTGIPKNDWTVKLEPGVSIDFVPVGDAKYAVRVYGFDDHWLGKIGDSGTHWLGRSAQQWFTSRSISFAEADIEKDTDIHDAALHPLLTIDQIDGGLLEWLFSASPLEDNKYRRLWIESPRVSSNALNTEANLERLMKSRRQNLLEIIPVLQSNAENSVFYRVDLEATAALLSREDFASSSDKSTFTSTIPGAPLLVSKAAMYEATLLRHKAKLANSSGPDPGEELEAKAFSSLRHSLMSDTELPVAPAIDIQEDQIVWGRSPIRLDLAGGYSDLPPYCLQHGGKVINIAVNLNGQPPIQVFAKKSRTYEILVRSIDLGVEQRLRTYEDVGSFAEPGSEFALAKAALSLAGFLPAFNKTSGFPTLEAQLRAFGSGIELSMMVAIPAGSGLGTSSILAATLLGTLSNLCSLNWSRPEICWRVLVLEQMLTTGGGWQDQVGGVYGGLKVSETYPGLKQIPVVRWLPETLFSSNYANGRILLYYTGITRMAKSIIHDIICGMFLNRTALTSCIDQILENVDYATHAVQLGDYNALIQAVHRSWEINKWLDAGTNPPSVQAHFDLLKDLPVKGKLLGAGGGGYLLLLAEDNETGNRVRERLTRNPLNARARFVDISTSQTGLEVTRS